MSSTKLITGLLIGAGAAIAIGYLMSDKGSEMREKIKQGGKDVLDFLCDAIDNTKEKVNEYAEEVKNSVEEKVTGNA